MNHNFSFSETQNFVNGDWGNERSLLHIAVSENNMVLAEGCFHRGVDVNKVDSYGNTALFYCRSVEVTKFLVDNGADVNILNFDGQTAVIYLYEHYNESFIYLMTIADLDLADNSKASSTLLGAMIQRGESELSIVQMVINGTKNLNKLDKYGNSYLIQAARHRKYKEVIMSLVKAGCDMYIKNSNGNNFYDLAYGYVKKEIEKNYPEFMNYKDKPEQQIRRYLKLKRLAGILPVKRIKH